MIQSFLKGWLRERDGDREKLVEMEPECGKHASINQKLFPYNDDQMCMIETMLVKISLTFGMPFLLSYLFVSVI